MSVKILFGAALLVCVAVTLAAEGGAASPQVTPPISGNSYSGSEDCGLPAFEPGFVAGGCVTLGDASLYGICGAQNSPYDSWCEACYPFVGLKQQAFGKEIGAYYGASGSIRDGTSGSKYGEDCEYSDSNCGTCETVKSNCLRDTPLGYDFTNVNVREYCCDADDVCPPADEPITKPSDPDTTGCWTCSLDDEGCRAYAWNEGNTCFKDANNRCLAGVCTTVDTVKTCVGQEPVVCNDGNDCTQDPDCVAATGCPDSVPKSADSPCSNGKLCDLDCVCDGAAVCGNCTPRACPEAYSCSETTGQCEANQSDLAPFFLAGAGGLLLLAGAAGVMAKKRNSVVADEKRNSVMSQKSDMTRGNFASGAAGSRKSASSQASRFTRGPGATGAAGLAGAAEFDQVSRATRNSGSASRGSRVSKVSHATTGTRSSSGSGGRRSTGGRSNGSRGRSVGGVSNGTRSSGGRSSASGKSRNSHGTRSSGGSGGRRSSGGRR